MGWGVVLLCGNNFLTAYIPSFSDPALLSQVSSLSSIALPSLTCTLSAISTSSWLYDEEGLPQISEDGKKVVLPCYGSTAGNPLSLAATKFAAVLSSDGSVATYSGGAAIGSGQGSAAAPNALRTIASQNGSIFYWGIAGRTWNPSFSSWSSSVCSCNGAPNGCCQGTSVTWPSTTIPVEDYTSTGVYFTSSTSSTPSTVGDNCWGSSTKCSYSASWSSTSCGGGSCSYTFSWTYNGATASYSSPAGAIAGFGYFWGGIGVYSGSLYASDMGGTSGANLANGMLTFSGLPAWHDLSTSFFDATTLAPAGSKTKYGNFVFESSTSVYLTETTNLTVANVGHYSNNQLSPGVWTWSRVGLPLIESNAKIMSIAGRSEGCAGFVLYLTSPTTLYRYETVSDTKIVLATAPANTFFRGVTLAPALTPFVWTPCSPVLSTSVMALRLGSGAAAITRGKGQALFLDEFVSSTPLAPPRSTINIPSQSCALSALSNSSWLFDAEGLPQISTDGTRVVFPCYQQSAGSILSPSAYKVAAQVLWNSTVNVTVAPSSDFTKSPQSSLYPHALRTIASVDGSAFWWGVSAQSTDTSGSGVYYTTSSGQVSTVCNAASTGPCIGKNNVFTGGIGIFQSTLYASDEGASYGSGGFVNGLVQWSGLPVSSSFLTTQTIATSTLVSTGVLTTFGNFIFESSTSVFITELSNLSNANVGQYTKAGGIWTRTPILIESGTAMPNIAGRTECFSFVLYLTSPTKLYQYTVATSTKVVLAVAPNNTVFRGAVIAPAVSFSAFPGCITLSATATASTTVSITATAVSTVSPTTTVSPTGASTYYAVTPTSSYSSLATVQATSTSTATVASSLQFCSSDVFRTILFYGLLGDFFPVSLGVSTEQQCRQITCSTPGASAYSYTSSTLQCLVMANATQRFFDTALTTSSGVLWTAAFPSLQSS